MKKYLLVLIGIVAVTSLGYAWSAKSGEVQEEVFVDQVTPPEEDPVKMAEETQGSVVVEPADYDFGDIIQSDGPVSTVFVVENTGEEVVVINRLSTSCGCTDAEMNLDPLEPGERREMTVTFDPMVHPDQFGEIVRVVYLQTSDSVMPEIEINIKGYVIE